MIRRTVALTERRTRPVKLPRGELDFLLAHAGHLIEVVPDLAPNTYRLTPRGYVGFIDGPTTRYAIGPKFPWPNIRMLLDLPAGAGIESLEPESDLLAVLADAFAERLEAVVKAGLVAGYGEASAVSSFLRGKLRTADQMRDAAARAFPDHFHIDEPVFDLHTPWNRIPKATATVLLGCVLPAELRQRIASAVEPLSVLPNEPVTDADFVAAQADPRTGDYKGLLDVCQMILNGLTSTDPIGTESGAFLVDLGRAFERYLTSALAREFEPRPEWRLESQPAFAVGPVELKPDILLRKKGDPWAVLDAKWKTAALDSNDLHQILAYATLVGAGRVALVYPGRYDERAHFSTPDGRVRVSVYRLRLAGTAEELALSITNLARSVRKE